MTNSNFDDWQIGRLGAVEDAPDILADLTIHYAARRGDVAGKDEPDGII